MISIMSQLKYKSADEKYKKGNKKVSFIPGASAWPVLRRSFLRLSTAAHAGSANVPAMNDTFLFPL